MTAQALCPDCGREDGWASASCPTGACPQTGSLPCLRIAYARAKARAERAEAALSAALKQAPHSDLCALRPDDDLESCDCWRSLADAALSGAAPPHGGEEIRAALRELREVQESGDVDEETGAAINRVEHRLLKLLPAGEQWPIPASRAGKEEGNTSGGGGKR